MPDETPDLMATLDPKGELAILFPSPKRVTIAGRDIEIQRCGIAQAGRIIDAGAPLYARISAGAEFLELFDGFPEETTDLLREATGADREWLASLDPVEQFELAAAWMEVNAGFFAQRLLPAVARYRKALNAIATIADTAGPTSSPS